MIAGILLAAALAAPVPDPAIALGAIETVKRPTVADLMNAYPPQALVDHKEGEVVLLCTVTARDSLADCRARANPPGLGFEAGAQKLVGRIGLKPGAYPAGARLVVPVSFALSPEPPGPPRQPALYIDGAHGGPGPFMPVAAVRARQNGIAAIDCHIDAKGALSQCQAAYEAPTGFDFAAATLRMAQAGRIAALPVLVDGKPLADRVRVDVVYLNEGWARMQGRLMPDPTDSLLPMPPAPGGPKTPQTTDAERRAAMVTISEDMASGGMVTVSRPGAWAVRPTYAEVQAAKPKGVVENGYVTVRCAVRPDGLLKDCDLAWEEPKALGFGAAALALAPRFRLTPEAAQFALPKGGAAFMLQWEGKGGPCLPPSCHPVIPPPPPGGWKAPAAETQATTPNR